MGGGLNHIVARRIHLKPKMNFLKSIAFRTEEQRVGTTDTNKLVDKTKRVNKHKSCP